MEQDCVFCGDSDTSFYTGDYYAYLCRPCALSDSYIVKNV